jgi:hypothetical protein
MISCSSYKISLMIYITNIQETKQVAMLFCPTDRCVPKRKVSMFRPPLDNESLGLNWINFAYISRIHSGTRYPMSRKLRNTLDASIVILQMYIWSECVLVVLCLLLLQILKIKAFLSPATAVLSNSSA